MPTSKVWPASPSAMFFKVYLLVDEIKQIPVDKLEDCHDSCFAVQVEWKGSPRKLGFLPEVAKKNYTSKRHIQDNGIIRWDEGFDHTCKLKKGSSQKYRSWVIKLEIQEFDHSSELKTEVVGKDVVDIADFAELEDEKSIRIPLKWNIEAHSAEVLLIVKLQLTKFQTKGSTAITRALSARLFSCTRFPRTDITKPSPTIDLESSNNGDDGELEEKKDNKHSFLHQSHENTGNHPSLLSFLSLDNPNFSFSTPMRSIGSAELNKACGEDGGEGNDSICQHKRSIHFHRRQQETKLQQRESSRLLECEDGGRSEIGSWEKKVVVSRDGQMELSTDIFFASIDQCNAKVAGENACAVLAVVIADWLHKNPNILPQQCQFDDLVHGGSSEWRNLCSDKNHKDKFNDQHFDLDTVLEAKIRDLSVATEMSYIGFLSTEDMINDFDFLTGAMSFDRIWKELVCVDATEERIYITGWNDHFFVLKVEKDVIYLIDTLGERLFEGCNKAYILKFNKESTIHRRMTEENSQTRNSKGFLGKTSSQSAMVGMDSNFSKKVYCKGRASCKEFIKEFLASLPLRELQHDIKRGVSEKSVSRRLQIEFYFTVPSSLKYLN